METARSGEVLAHHDGVAVVPLHGPDVEAAVAFLGTAEAERGAPVVDESERERLRRLTGGEVPGWQPLLAVGDGETQGYAGLNLPDETGPADCELVVQTAAPQAGLVSHLLTEALREAAAAHGCEELRIWRRAITGTEMQRMEDRGAELERRLLVLGRGLSSVSDPDLPGGVTVRMYEPDVDDHGVVEVLQEAYEGEIHWDLEEFRRRREMPWFDPDDLLVAEGRNGDLAGIHWTKRRDGSLGEVYNLAIRPYAQGLGLGRALLCEGLAYLARVGCEEVILWVDEANGAAVDLYRSEGFTDRWADVAFRDRR